MPAPGAGLKNGPRHKVLSRELWMKFKETHNSDISYQEFRNIICTTLEDLSEIITENPEGLKLPEGLGYIVVSRYKPAEGRRSIDFKKTKEFGTVVYHTNYHSFGYKPKLLWLTVGLSRCKYVSTYKIVPDRKLWKKVSANMLDGKIYNEHRYDHFRAKHIKLKLPKDA